ncbi:MAG: hypothetical protein PHH98_02030 [Candidatus Gracilibacteria bacterium]|nr:hypothetical protein [Candidatus Gracilibacteria bacterium]
MSLNKGIDNQLDIDWTNWNTNDWEKYIESEEVKNSVKDSKQKVGEIVL